jgi:hypothetical protein
MKRFMQLLSLLTIIVLLAACAPQAAPTPSLAELQATAMAKAQAQVALTAAAIPTATAIPPTPVPPTPIPPTEPPVQIVPQTPIPAIVQAPADPLIGAESNDGNACNSSLNVMKGPHVSVTFINKAKGQVSFYFYIYQTAFGCGFSDVSLDSGDSTTISVPQGCYDFYGWVNGAKPSTPAGYGCFKKDTPATVTIRADDVIVLP